MFFFAGVYADHDAGAEVGYEAIKGLHARHDIGWYDAATITKDVNGKVRVAKTEKPSAAQRWIGLAAGAGWLWCFRSSYPRLLSGVRREPDWVPGSGTSPTAQAGRKPRRLARYSTEGNAALIVVESTMTRSRSRPPPSTQRNTCSGDCGTRLG